MSNHGTLKLNSKMAMAYVADERAGGGFSCSQWALVHLLLSMQADTHESTTLDRIKEEEPEFYSMVSRVLKRAEMEFAL